MNRSSLGTGLFGLLLLLGISPFVAAAELAGNEALTILSGRPAEAEAAILRLREAGPAGLEVLFQHKKAIQDEIRRLAQTNMPPPHDPNVLVRLDNAIDRVGGAKYCTASRLYWYTDFEQAKAVAEHCGKPILTLRMLGNLTDEFSCANSRFFRTTLYSNEEIAKTLRERFVLHWKSVRPVPKVTIDFGDGRKLERTITGNSIHYVLMPDGQVVDAIPGLYGPKAFLKQLTRGEALVRLLADASAERRTTMLADYHAQQAAEATKAWEADWNKAMAAMGTTSGRDTAARETAEEMRRKLEAMLRATEDVNQADSTARPAQQQQARVQPPVPPRAEAATRIAVPKAKVEAPLVRAVNLAVVAPEDVQEEKIWNVIASFHSNEARLDNASREVIRAQAPPAAAAGRRALTKRVIEDPMLRLFAAFESSIALDTVKNEYQFHRKIHQWLSTAEYRPDVEALNERVYAELFLTPSSDPWLGLAPADVYTALPNGGVVSGK